ncbi:MAG TPA: hypothetical protein DCL69_08800, partial [Firmicutes bacterium]|nr:hypothetical protein [Bacillota bacterium]
EKILKTDKEDKSLCPNTKNSVFIDAYGDVFPCINFRYKIGDVFSADLKNIWLGLERRYLLSLDKNMLTHCRSCNLQQECYPCPGLALLEDGSMFACSSSARKMAEAEHRNKKKGG